MDFKHDILPLKDKLFRMALRITMQREEAEDVVQDVMIKMWNNRSNWGNIDNIESYAMTSCRNMALDRLRRRHNITTTIENIPDDIATAGRTTENILFAKEQLNHVYDLMAQLPEKQRTCMQLRDFEGKNYKEIAEIMQISEDQVKVNIFRARNFIKKSCTEV